MRAATPMTLGEYQAVPIAEGGAIPTGAPACC